MNDFIVPKVIKKGDTIALISLSGGRAGDEDMLLIQTPLLQHHW